MLRRENYEAGIVEGLADIWCHLTDEQRHYLQRRLSIERYKKNEPIYAEGDKPTHLLCPLTGKVKIFKSGVGGRTQIVRVIKPVEYFGYRAYFAKEDYVTGAAAFEPTTICTIPMEALERVMMENSGLAMFFVERLAVDLGISDERTVNLTQKHVRGRLAEALIFLKESYGTEDDGRTLGIQPSRDDLASLSNMTTSNAIRTLSNFVTEGIIAVEGRRITVCDEERLKRISRKG